MTEALRPHVVSHSHRNREWYSLSRDAAEGTIHLARPFQVEWLTNLSEDARPGELEVDGHGVRFPVRAHGVATILFETE